jgi:phosphate transport system substrate-binding protein
VPQSVKIRDTLICTDTCTIDTCGVSSKLTPRFDAAMRAPLVDFGGSDALLTASDYKAFPDLLMLPSLAAAVVPVYNIPELTASMGPLILSRQNMADIYSGDLKLWSDQRIAANNLNLDLSRIVKPIRVVVRTDSSGTSQIFTAALASFDPKGSDI